MLRTFAGEAYVNQSYGIPWFSDVLGADVLRLNYIRGIISEKILAMPGVQSLNALDLKTVGRNMSGTFSITVTGRIIQGEF